MRPITDRFRAAVGVSRKVITRIGVTVPGGDELLISESATAADGSRKPGWTKCEVSSSNSSGPRYSADLDIVPAPGEDTYAIVSTPGAVFTIEHGIDYGAGNVELIDFGVYEAADGQVNILGGVIQLSLVDNWQSLEAARFLAPYTPGTGTRASRISAAVTGALSSATVTIEDDGGTFTTGNTWDRDRTEFIRDMARDGSLDAAFDAAGEFRIREQPTTTPTETVWTFTTGEASNIMTAERERPFDRLYNTVVVVPQEETQTWTQQKVSLDDTSHPRHPSNLGYEVPYFYSSPTLKTGPAALAAGRTILQRVQGVTETLALNTIGNPALEVGDAVQVIHSPTDTDPGFTAIHYIDAFRFDCRTAAMSLSTRSSLIVTTEDS